MSKEKLSVDLSSDGIGQLIKAVKDYQKWLTSKISEFLTRLAAEGVVIASVQFRQAQYDGTNDVTVHSEERDGKRVAIVAVGSATLFIEFGTGILYPDTHPEAAENGMVRGEYGHRLGRLQKGWRYEGSPGTNGEIITEGKHAGEIRTRGNPANMPMYNTVRELEDRFTEIAKEVFV